MDSFTPMVPMDKDLVEGVDNNSAEEDNMKPHHQTDTLVPMPLSTAMELVENNQLIMMLELKIIMLLLLNLKQHTMEIPLQMLLLMN